MAKPKHDPFFTKSMQCPAIANSFLQQHIPLELKDHIIWETLHRIDRNDTDSKLTRLQRDSMYQASTRKGGNIILNTEHQSKADFLMPIRFLRYNANVLEAYLEEGHAKWPLLINLLLYNGSKAPYPYPNEATDYYEEGNWGIAEMFLRFYLIVLTQISDQVLLTHGVCAPLEILLKHSRGGKLELNTSEYAEVFHDCVREVGDEYITSMLAYIDSLKSYEIGDKMHKFVEVVFQDKQEIIMTYGQKLKQEAKQEGIREGLIQGIKEGMQAKAIEMAKTMLKEGELVEKIMRWTGLSKEAIEKLKKE